MFTLLTGRYLQIQGNRPSSTLRCRAFYNIIISIFWKRERERVRSVTKQVFKQNFEPAGIMILGLTHTHTPPGGPEFFEASITIVFVDA